MTLTLTKKANLPSIGKKYTYSYDCFTMTVLVTEERTVEIHASDGRDIEISALNQSKSVIEIQYAILKEKKKIDSFIEKMKLASELKEIIDKKRDDLISGVENIVHG